MSRSSQHNGHTSPCAHIGIELGWGAQWCGVACGREEQVGETKTHASKKRSEEERAIKLRKDKTTNHHCSKPPRKGRNEQFACSNTLIRKASERQSSSDALTALTASTGTGHRRNTTRTAVGGTNKNNAISCSRGQKDGGARRTSLHGEPYPRDPSSCI